MNINVRPPTKTKVWTEEDDAKWRKMRADGYSWPLINSILGGNAEKRCTRLRLTPEQKAARRLKDSAREATGINIGWTEEQVELLKKLYFEGLSYSLIAPQVGNSRSACLGKVKRLHLPKRVVTQSLPNPTRMKRTKIHQPRVRLIRANGNSPTLRLVESVQTEMEFLRCVEVVSMDLKIDQLTDTTCRFIAGDACADGGALYCGNLIFKRSLCEKHFALSYEQPKPHKPQYVRRYAA